MVGSDSVEPYATAWPATLGDDMDVQAIATDSNTNTGGDPTPPTITVTAAPSGSDFVSVVTGVPDGSHQVQITDMALNVLYSGVATYSGGSATIPLSVVIGSRVTGFTFDDLVTTTEGTHVYGVTE